MTYIAARNLLNRHFGNRHDGLPTSFKTVLIRTHLISSFIYFYTLLRVMYKTIK